MMLRIFKLIAVLFAVILILNFTPFEVWMRIAQLMAFVVLLGVIGGGLMLIAACFGR